MTSKKNTQCSGVALAPFTRRASIRSVLYWANTYTGRDLYGDVVTRAARFDTDDAQATDWCAEHGCWFVDGVQYTRSAGGRWVAGTDPRLFPPPPGRADAAGYVARVLDDLSADAADGSAHHGPTPAAAAATLTVLAWLTVNAPIVWPHVAITTGGGLLLTFPLDRHRTVHVSPDGSVDPAREHAAARSLRVWAALKRRMWDEAGGRWRDRYFEGALRPL